MSTRYKGDPYWLTARFTSRCNRCQEVIVWRKRPFTIPEQNIYCNKPACGQACSGEFEAAAQDEDFYNSQY